MKIKAFPTNLQLQLIFRDYKKHHTGSLGKINVLIEKEKYTLANEFLDSLKESFSHIKTIVESNDALINYSVYASQIANTGIELNYKIAQLEKKDKKKYIIKAFEFLQLSKASALNSSIAENKAKKIAGIPKELLDLENSLNQQIEKYHSKLEGTSDEQKKISFQAILFNLRSEKDSLKSIYKREFPKYWENKFDRSIVDIDELQKSLPKKSAVLSYFYSTKSIYCFIIDKKGINIHSIPLNEKNRKYIKAARNIILFKKKKTYCKAFSHISDILLPKKILSNKYKQLFIIPDGVLNRIPFEAFFYKEHQYTKGEKWEDFPFLIKNKTVSYAISTKNLFNSLKDNSKTTYKKEVLALAPVFKEKEQQLVNEKTKGLISKLDAKENKAIGTIVRSGQISCIPGTEKEVKEIEKHFESNNQKTEVKIGLEATENFIKNHPISDYRFLHIASHGFINVESPSLSGILLYKDTSMIQEDGILFSGEIYNININSELVTLSACQTGAGKIQAGEGVMGLSRAFFFAGAKNLNVSLWKVSDNSTEQLMVYFYNQVLEKKRNNNNFASSLRKAKIKLIEGGKYACPYYWASFVLIGK